MRKAASPSALLCCFLLAAPLQAAESTRVLKAELPAAAQGRFRVENLAGSMRVVPATDGRVTAVATVHAESDKDAGLMRFEQVSGADGVPTLRVIYPLDKYEAIRYDSGAHQRGLWGGMGSNTSTKYDGHRVKVSSGDGVLLYADLEVHVPPVPGLEVVFRNEVGRLEAEGVEGKLRFDSSSADIILKRLKGEIHADTGSGDVKAGMLEGAFSCNTGSGDCHLTGFEGERLVVNVGSGDVYVKSARAGRISAETGSGDIFVTDSDAEGVEADTGSGDVTLESRGGRMVEVKAQTGSGDVTLRLGPEATFEARADQGSGDIGTGFKDAEVILQHRRVVGYRRGDARIRIEVSTGSGDLRIDPLR